MQPWWLRRYGAAVEQVTLAVLVGGASSRMGFPKEELKVGGLGMLEHLCVQLKWAGPTMAVVSPDRPRPSGVGVFQRVVVDGVVGGGPLEGVRAALRACETAEVVVVAVDMPEVNWEGLSWLVNQRRAMRAGVVMVRRGGKKVEGVESREWIEPLPMVCDVGVARGGCERLLGGGVRSLQSLGREVGVVVDEPEGGLGGRGGFWTNLNRPEDLKAYLERNA